MTAEARQKVDRFKYCVSHLTCLTNSNPLPLLSTETMANWIIYHLLHHGTIHAKWGKEHWFDI